MNASSQREALLRNQENIRINEVARLANQIQKQTGCTRTEALRIAEKITPN